MDWLEVWKMVLAAPRTEVNEEHWYHGSGWSKETSISSSTKKQGPGSFVEHDASSATLVSDKFGQANLSKLFLV